MYDNYGEPGTADRAMRVLRPGGVYLMLPHMGCMPQAVNKAIHADARKATGPPCLTHRAPGKVALRVAE